MVASGALCRFTALHATTPTSHFCRLSRFSTVELASVGRSTLTWFITDSGHWRHLSVKKQPLSTLKQLPPSTLLFAPFILCWCQMLLVCRSRRRCHNEENCLLHAKALHDAMTSLSCLSKMPTECPATIAAAAATACAAPAAMPNAPAAARRAMITHTTTPHRTTAL